MKPFRTQDLSPLAAALISLAVVLLGLWWGRAHAQTETNLAYVCKDAALAGQPANSCESADWWDRVSTGLVASCNAPTCTWSTATWYQPGDLTATAVLLACGETRSPTQWDRQCTSEPWVTQAQAAGGTPAFTPRRAKCYLTRIDQRWKIQSSGPDALVWWCNTPEGIKRHYRAGETDRGTVGRLISLVFGGSDDSLWELDRLMTDRVATSAEFGVVSEIEWRYGPRCYTRTTGTATAVPVYGRKADGTRGARRIGSDGAPMSIAPDVPTACGWRLVVTTPTDSNRYCYVQLLTATNGQQIPMDSWALCRYQRSPAEGWPQ